MAKTDWKLLKNREELFFRYFTWRISVHDLDHSHYCRVLAKGLTDEQRCWFSFLFGMTYRSPQAYAYWWTFPDFNRIDLDELDLWHADNWRRTTYGTDVRYNKGHFHEQVRSLREWVGGMTLLSKVRALVSTPDPMRNFNRLFNSVRSVNRYGRMTGWITCQCLYDTVGIPIDFDNVLVCNPADDSGMASVWNGYWTLKGQTDQMLGEKYGGGRRIRPTDAEVSRASAGIMEYRERACRFAGIPSVDVFKWESVWCQFKRLFREPESHEYPGHASGDAASRYLYYKEHWPEVDWAPFREALLTQPSMIRGQIYVNEYNKVFGRTGLLLNMHEMFGDVENAYEILGLDPNENLVRALFEDHSEEVPVL